MNLKKYIKKEKRRMKNEKRADFLVFFFLFSFFTFNLSAQTAAQLETILEAPTVTCGQAAFVVLEGTSNAFQQAQEKGWLKNASMDDPITMGQLSFLMMKAYDLKGGLMYAIFPSPRYAYRSMVSRSFIQGSSDPSMTVNGERFLLIFGRVLTEVEATGDDNE